MLEAVGFINITRQCNVDCHRCYLTESNRKASERLSDCVLQRFLDHPFWFEREVTLIWEGGEPTVVGRQAMERYCEVARSSLPHARQTMVTNLFSVPDWLIELIRNEFGGNVETTYAGALKRSLAGSEEVFQKQFFLGLNKLWRNGIECPVNVELNTETVAAGVDALATAILKSDCRIWEFDISVDFHSFLRHPQYEASSVPVLPLTATYKMAWDFLLELRDKWGEHFRRSGVSIGVFEQKPGQMNNQFNVSCENRFLTLNPDGVVTTNPLYSDLEGTFLGSLAEVDMDAILSNRKRLTRILADKRRASACKSCEHYDYCAGGPSHVPVHDGSGDCAGGKRMWERLLETQEVA